MARERRRRRRVREEEQPATEEEVQEEEVEETKPDAEPTVEEKAPTSRRRSRSEASGTTDGADLLAGLLGSLEVGKAVIIKQTGKNEYSVSLGDGVAAETVVSKPVKRVSRDVFLTPEYKEWSAEWSSKTYEEKLAYAKEHKTTWDEDPNVGINAMRVGMAVQAQLGIQKYKDGFESIKARNEAKALLQAGATVKGL